MIIFNGFLFLLLTCFDGVIFEIFVLAKDFSMIFQKNHSVIPTIFCNFLLKDNLAKFTFILAYTSK